MPQDFLAAWHRYRQGGLPLDELTRTLHAALDQDIRTATGAQRFILSARDRGELDESGFDGLMEAIDRILTEDVPTEYSLDADPEPAASAPSPADGGTRIEPLHPGAVLKDRYHLDECVAAGSCHQVFRATDQSPAHGQAGMRLLAIKVASAAVPADSPAVAALRREAAIGRQLTHANIVRSDDLDQDGPHTFLCLEWLEGESLARILDARRTRPMPRVQAMQIVEGICRGLAAAHAQGVVHADLKPGNVFITRDGQVKLLDFGAARVAGDAHPPVRRGHTPEYASCEVLEGAEPEPADDLFSTALVAYRMLAGERAFGQRTAREAEAEGLAPARIETLTPAQWRALNRALAFRRRDRQAGMTAFLAELKGPRDDGPAARGMAAPDPAVAPGPGPGRRWRLVAGAVAIALSGLAVGLKLGSVPPGTPAAPAPGTVASTTRPATAPLAAPTPVAPPPRASAPGTATTDPAPRPPAAAPLAAEAPMPGRAADRTPLAGVDQAPAASTAGPQAPAPDRPGPAQAPAAMLMTAALRSGPPVPDSLPEDPASRRDAQDAGDGATQGAPADTSPRDESVPFASLKLSRYVEPRYPSMSAVRGEPGWVEVQFSVDARGKPGKLEVLAAEPAGRFDEAALAAIRRWRFERPAGSGEVVTRIRVRFAPE